MDTNQSFMKERCQSGEKDEPNKQVDNISKQDSHFYDISPKERLLASDETDEHVTPNISNLRNECTDSPRTKLAKFIPERPFKINGNVSQVCDSKIFIKPTSFTNGSRSFHVALSMEEEEDEEYPNEHTYSKSCDCADEIIEAMQQNIPAISRSVSEDFLQRSDAALQRRISVVATSKGKLMGVPRVRPGEKLLVRSPSSSSQPISRTQQRILSVSSDVPKKSRFTAEQKWIAFCLCLVDFTAFLSMSIIAPFFPQEAASKGMREAVSGFVFSIYALVIMISSPVFGKILPHVGAKFMFLCGVGFCGGCNVLFGLLDKVNGQVEFAVLCFVVRSFEALGAAAFCTASCTILIDQFPDDIGTVFGFTETCIGVGMSIGPALGGALYAVGGFGLPFFTLGGLVMLVVPLCWYLLRNVKDPEGLMKPPVSYKKLLSMPHVVVVCLILAVSSQAQGFIDPTLEPHMRQYGLDASIVGLLFLLLSGAYAISSPIVGWVSGNVENKYPLMIIGLILVTIAMLLLGPSDILPLQGSVWLSIVSLILMGFSFAAAYVPTFESMFIAAMNGGLEDDINTYSVVSGLWNSMYSLGEVTGPSLGGILSDFFTFPEASTLMALCTLAAFLVALVAWWNPCECFGPYSLIEDAEEKLASSAENSEETDRVPSREQTPLQDGNVHTYGSLWEDKKNPVV
ncbi:MFS-type transporter SLC18B1-like isoform X2 [Stegodyphus dumicola]|nr:MFS-type transporter SLC18B1-like isoform X2 [Stegodyphus dumicola]XP_035210334.1 MFS-type transporter SLC18B1-like isoform X2 [Stegodyphus dumicola]XP_035210335.1 MFS-type transporter SLC18B1-like isoform X2 [Stegodyphus dumicola]XP_035210336.1 MFS-type transporter SLC18B1-like isoform X2 [Stegodyphus dumicola]XP_035210337.1 MFS-type transporter SLC18B1-like isoform X2 [Stegodyphus dumicola]XP_035210339.1 MFS-type transporter SLC18B1-like isoform X2 [Stegodyphus dumicola]